MDILKREFVYVWYYFSVQLEQIFRYWVLGMVLGSAISVFGKNKIHSAFSALGDKKAGGAGADSRKPAGDRLAAVHVWNHSHCGVFFAERDERRFRIASAFMITGPATKITNLGALKIVLGARRFALYLAFVMLLALAAGLLVDLIL